ncbi:hypothetical protein F4860DRAFT_519322 [Xylaria cubensis]|nr:hypothetical protein F4860DRAFT_519322 [Xylaria cubensis]
MALAHPAVPLPVAPPDWNNVTESVATSLEGMAANIRSASNMGPVHQAGAITEMQQSINAMVQAMTELGRDIRADITAAKVELNNNITAAKVELTRDIDTAKAALTGDIDTAKVELNNNITAAKVELTRDIDTAKAELNRDIGASITDLDINTQARVSNLKALSDSTPLCSLRNTTTHQVVRLPPTVHALNAAQKHTLDRLLGELGQELTSADTQVDRRQQLKQFIGMHT